MKAFVIMGNDYPEAVCSTETLADLYVEAKRAENAARLKAGQRAIHWRHYQFEMDKPL